MIPDKPLPVVFYQTASQKEPVREWLKSLSKSDTKIIGEDIKTVQYGWPLGMPLVEKLDADLWEIRSKLDNRISRVLITVHLNSIVLLHGFIKKTQKIPQKDLQLAKKRLSEVKSNVKDN